MSTIKQLRSPKRLAVANGSESKRLPPRRALGRRVVEALADESIGLLMIATGCRGPTGSSLFDSATAILAASVVAAHVAGPHAGAT